MIKQNNKTMKNIFIVSQTNIWYGDIQFCFPASTLNKAIKLIKSDKDLIANVKNKDSHIIIEEATLNEMDSERRVFDTGKENDRYRLIWNTVERS